MWCALLFTLSIDQFTFMFCFEEEGCGGGKRAPPASRNELEKINCDIVCLVKKKIKKRKIN